MMCGRSRRKYGFGAKGAHRHGFFGADVESMSPGSRVATALSVIVPVAMSGVFLVAFLPEIWWVFTIYGWVVFPALGLLAGGFSGISENRRVVGEESAATVESKERRLLEALRDHGELTPALAALETSLSVAEAERILRELAEGGYLEVLAHDGGVFYALWRSERDES